MLTAEASGKYSDLSWEIRKLALDIAVKRAEESGKLLIDSPDILQAYIQAAYEVLEEPYEDW